LAKEILSYWNELKADKTVKRDMKGKKAGMELRLDVPVKLVSLADRSSVHMRERVMTSKAEKGVSEEDLEVTSTNPVS
jgi:hypothetical protein